MHAIGDGPILVYTAASKQKVLRCGATGHRRVSYLGKTAYPVIWIAILILLCRCLHSMTQCRCSSGWIGGPTDNGESHSASRRHSHSRHRSDPITCILDFSKDDVSTKSTCGLRHLSWLIPRYVQIDVIDTDPSSLIDTLNFGLIWWVLHPLSDSTSSSVLCPVFSCFHIVWRVLHVCVHARGVYAASEACLSAALQPQ